MSRQFEGLYFPKKLHMKNFDIKNKDNKISQGRGLFYQYPRLCPEKRINRIPAVNG